MKKNNDEIIIKNQLNKKILTLSNKINARLNMPKQILFGLIVFLLTKSILKPEIYFPPLESPSWEIITPEELEWNTSKITELYDFLERNNTKAFLVLKDGKIVLEKYFGEFKQDSLWHWASAGKTLTATLVGIAQAEGYLSIYDITSKYLDSGWTSCPPEKENLITIRHQLTMTSGLDDNVDDPYCTKPECLRYIADAGTRWAYHNAPYTLLDKVVEKATGKNYNIYFNQKLRSKIGMKGLWVKVGYNNVYYSDARSMARFGILILNKGVWDKTRIIPENFFYEMINTSQELNKSYGYLFWLNGKESFMVAGFQIQFKGPLFKYAPMDLVSGLGKDGQIINISFQKSLVVVRMGNDPNFLTMTLTDSIWKYLNQIIEPSSFVNYYQNYEETVIVGLDFNKLEIPTNDFVNEKVFLFNLFGQKVFSDETNNKRSFHIDFSNLPKGIYLLRIGFVSKIIIKI